MEEESGAEILSRTWKGEMESSLLQGQVVGEVSKGEKRKDGLFLQ
jgi:hypothetical protein